MKFPRKKHPVVWRLAVCVLAWVGQHCPAVETYQPQFQDPMTEAWRWHAFPELSGLGAQCIGEGADGVIWFGTVGGLYAYDGLCWTNEAALGGLGVASICSGAKGDLFVANWGEIQQCSHGKWSRIFNSPDRGCMIRKMITTPDGSLWAATSWGLLRGAGSSWTLFTAPEIAERLPTKKTSRRPTIVAENLPGSLLARTRPSNLPNRRYDLNDICADKNGRLWLGTDGGEIICFDPGFTSTNGVADNWKLYNETDGVACGRTPSVLALRDGTVWVVYGSGSGYASVFDGGSWRKLDLTAAGVPTDCGNLLQTRDGAIWLSGRYVVAAFREGHWQTYAKPAVPIPSAHNFLLEAADGALWIGGPNTEVQRVDYGTTRWLTLRDLNFGCETPDGAQWFLHRTGRVVVHEPAGQWLSYGPEDGLMDAPVTLLGTKSGEVWAAGSHAHTAATARFDGKTWTRYVHSDFSWGMDWRAAFQSSDGSVWFGAAVDSSGPKEHQHGLLQFRDGQWIHHRQPGRFGGEAVTNPAIVLPATQRPEPIGKFFCLGESSDGKIWAGRSILVAHDGAKWGISVTPTNIRLGTIESMLTTAQRELWIGTRQFGAVRFDGHAWRQFQGSDSLVANSVYSLAQTANGFVWAATDRDVNCFDGTTWTAHVLPEALNVPAESGCLKTSPGGRLWINRFDRDWMIRAWSKASRPDNTNFDFWTVSHQFDGKPPRTVLITKIKDVPSPGSVSIAWTATAAWREPHEARLQFSFRLDGQSWSAYKSENSHAFFSLPSGRHHFEVRARDDDFNADPVPATLDFSVLPPVWRQGWFIALLGALVAAIVFLTVRVLWEQTRLRAARDELEIRVHERTAQLEAANKELESFSYSVSHDLRAPLRAIDGFCRIFLEDNAQNLNAEGRDQINRVCVASQRMGRLIDDLLDLSRVTRSVLHRGRVDVSALAAQVVSDLHLANPGRQAEVKIQPGLIADADENLLRIVLENLLGNAWKFTGKQPVAQIEMGCVSRDGQPTFFVRDNGAGFDMAHAGKLFGAFQRLHRAADFPGTGIGLATVQRIIHRHGGQVSAESAVDRGATFYFTLPNHTTNA